MKGKLKWIIGIIVIIAIISAVVIIIMNKSDLTYTIEEIKDYNYFSLIENEKYGVIDKNGNVVVEPIYIAVQIPNPSKPVFICIKSYNQETKEYETVVYNDKKEELFTDYQNVQAISIQTNVETVPYEKSVLMYKKDSQYGLINLQGKEVTKPIYQEISSVNYKEGCFLVKQDGLYGVINMNGKVVIPCGYETINSDNYYNEITKNETTGFIVSKRTEEGYRYGYINYLGKMILKPEYTELERVTQIANDKELYFIAFKDGQAGLLKNKEVILNYEYEEIIYHSVNDIFIVQRNGKQGAVARDGQIILHAEYDDVLFGGIYLNAVKGDENLIFDLKGQQVETTNISMSKTENEKYYIAIDKNDIYTIVDADGNVLVDDNYTYIEYLPNDYFIVAREGKNGIIDSTGKFIVDLKYTSIFSFNDTHLIEAEITDTQTIELYNTKMEKVASMDNAIIKEYEPSDINPNRYILLSSENDFAYYDVNGNQIEAKDVFPNMSLYAKKIDGKWGFVDKQGNIKVENKYEMATDFNQYGFAGIKENGKWGVINQEGTIIQNPVYELDWTLPSFLGKYYHVNTWYGDERYSSDTTYKEDETNEQNQEDEFDENDILNEQNENDILNEQNENEPSNE